MGIPAPLIDVPALAGRLAGPDGPVLLDVRWQLGGPPGIDSYRAGHLPGAAFLDLDSDLADPPGAGGRHPLPSAARFQAAMRRAGVRAGVPVVAYDDAAGTVAARAWWLLRYFGHQQVAVLDGGFPGWAAAGQPVATGESPAVPPGNFTAAAGGMPVLDAAGAAIVARSGILLDARAADRYRGDVEPVDRAAGHIPGAVSAPTAQNVAADGRLRTPGQLRARFAALGVPVGAGGAFGAKGAFGIKGAEGIREAKEARGAQARGDGQEPLVGAYCGSGVTAAHEVLALELAGIPAALYVGSWSGWVADPGRPVATGPAPS